ncbi:helicase associated domain-containing protein [Arthrobacter sp. Sr33]|uniref:helicase associated domain-containing protein n=1 Tax=Arthrobacter sp. TB 23 TaxID=494419 RepID=UPI00036A8DAB|nr:helicase associated domain-containing protein [Arthrobacter sp. TB 23]
MAVPAGIEAEGPEDWGPCISAAEWRLMYLRGMSSEQIAHHCRVPLKRVRRVILTFQRTRPELAGKRLMLHDQPSLPSAADRARKPPRPSWEKRLQEVRTFYRRRRRMPRALSKDPAEKRMAEWVAGQRRQIRRGTMAEERRAALQDAFGDWVGPPRAEAHVQLWAQRLDEVAAFQAAEGHLPRFRRGEDRHENILSTWVTTQPGLHRDGTLDPDRHRRLDERIPRWETWRR